MVWSPEEGSQSPSTHPQPRTSEQGHDSTFRCRSNPWTLSRTVQRKIVWRNARLFRSVRRKESCRIVSRSNNFSDPLRSTSYRNPAYGLDEFSLDNAWQCHSYPSAWNSPYHDSLHRWRPYQRSEIMLPTLRWCIRNNSRKFGNSTIRMGALQEPQPNCTAYEVLRRNLFRS